MGGRFWSNSLQMSSFLLRGCLIKTFSCLFFEPSRQSFQSKHSWLKVQTPTTGVNSFSEERKRATAYREENAVGLDSNRT